MAYDASFGPNGKTVFIASAAVAPTGIQVVSDDNRTSTQYLIWNSDTTNDAWIGYGDSAAAATANAVIPTAGNPKGVLCIPHGSAQTFTLKAGLYFSPICSAGTPGIYITPGAGL